MDIGLMYRIQKVCSTDPTRVSWQNVFVTQRLP
jgi:hypothetical protein